MTLHPSPRCTSWLICAHLLAAWAVAAAALSLPIKLLVLALIAASLVGYAARDALLRLPVSWLGLSVAHGEARVLTRAGSEWSGVIAGTSVVTPYFVLLHVRPQGAHGTVSRVIFPDMLVRDEFRELCVLLRFP